MRHPEVLARVLKALEQAGIPYMLTGSFASAFHGIPRSTQDIDLVIAPSRSQLANLVRMLGPPDYYVSETAAMEAYRDESHFNVLDLASAWKIDLIIRKSRPFSETEFDRRMTVDFDGMPIFIVRAEDLVIAKLEWAGMGQSRRQLEDAAGILRVRAGQVDLEYIGRWVAELGLEREWEEARRPAGA
jgi:hypothetical protein